MAQQEVIRQLIQPQNCYSVFLARFLAEDREADIPAAIYLQQLCYWSDKGKLADNWIYKGADELERETGLTRKQQTRIREKLVTLGILKTELHKAVTPESSTPVPILHYQVQFTRLIELLDKHIGENPVLTKGKNPPVLTKGKNPIHTETTAKTTKQEVVGIANQLPVADDPHAIHPAAPAKEIQEMPDTVPSVLASGKYPRTLIVWQWAEKLLPRKLFALNTRGETIKAFESQLTRLEESAKRSGRSWESELFLRCERSTVIEMLCTSQLPLKIIEQQIIWALKDLTNERQVSPRAPESRVPPMAPAEPNIPKGRLLTERPNWMTEEEWQFHQEEERRKRAEMRAKEVEAMKAEEARKAGLTKEEYWAEVQAARETVGMTSVGATLAKGVL